MANSVLDKIFQNGCTDSICQRIEAKETDYIGIPLAKRNFKQSNTAEKIKNLSGGDKLTDKFDDTEINAVSTKEIQERFDLYVIRVADNIHLQEVSSKDYVKSSCKNCADKESLATQTDKTGGSVTEDSLNVQAEKTENVENYTTVTTSVSSKTFKQDVKQQIAQRNEIHNHDAECLSNSESNIKALSADNANNYISEQVYNDSVINSHFENINIKTECVDPEFENSVYTSKPHIVDVTAVPQNKQSNEIVTIDRFNVDDKLPIFAIEEYEKISNIDSKQEVVTNNINESKEQSEYGETSDCRDVCKTQSEGKNDLSISMPTEVYIDIDHDDDDYCAYDYTDTNNFLCNTHAATCSSDRCKEKSNITSKEILKDKVFINNIKVIKDSMCNDKLVPNIASKTAKVISKQHTSETQGFQKKIILFRNRVGNDIGFSYSFSDIKMTSTDYSNVKQNRNYVIKGKRKLDSADDGIISDVKKKKYPDLKEESERNKTDNHKEISDKISNSNKKVSTNKEVKENKHELNNGSNKSKGNYREEQRMKEKKCTGKKSNNNTNITETLLTGIKQKKNPLPLKDSMKKIDVQQDNTRTDSQTCNSNYMKGELIVDRDINSKSLPGSKRRNSEEKSNTDVNKISKNSLNEVDRGRKIKDQNTRNHGTDYVNEVKRHDRCVNEMKRPCRDKESFEKGKPVCKDENRRVSDKSQQYNSSEKESDIIEADNEHASNSNEVILHSASEINNRKRMNSGQDNVKADDKSNTISNSLLHSPKSSKRRNNRDGYEVNLWNCKKIKTSTDENKCKKNGFEKQNFNQTASNISYVQKDMNNKSPKPHVVNSDTHERIWKWLSACDEMDGNKTDHQKKSLPVKFDFKIPKKSNKEISSKVETRTTSVNSSTVNCGEGMSLCPKVIKGPQIETTLGKKNRQRLNKNDDCKHTVNNSKIECMDEVTSMELVHETESMKAGKKLKEAHVANSLKQNSVQKNSDKSKQLAHQSSEITNKERKITSSKTNSEKILKQNRHKSGDSDKSATSENKSNKYSNDKMKQPDKYEDKFVSVSSDVVSKANNKKVENAGDRNNMDTENILVHEVNRTTGINTKQKLIENSSYFVKGNREKVIQPKEVDRKNNTHIMSKKPGGTNFANREFSNENILKSSFIAHLDEEQTTLKCFGHGQDKTGHRTKELLNKKDNKSNTTDGNQKEKLYQCETCKNAFFTHFEDLKKHEVKCISTVCGNEKGPKCKEVKPFGDNKVISTVVSKVSVECDVLSKKSPTVRERSSTVVESDSLEGDKSNLGGQNSCTIVGKKTNNASVDIQSDRMKNQSMRACEPYVNNNNLMIQCQKCEKSWFSNEYKLKIHQQKCVASNQMSESSHCSKKDIVNCPNSTSAFAEENKNKMHDHDAGRSCKTKFIPPLLSLKDSTNHGFSGRNHPDGSIYRHSRGGEMCHICRDAFFSCKTELMNHVHICRKKRRNKRRRRKKNFR